MLRWIWRLSLRRLAQSVNRREVTIHNAAETQNLTAFSRAVRESSIKRLRLVPEGRENWRPAPEAMSFADLARHLIDADEWLFEKLVNPALEPMVGRAGLAGEATDRGVSEAG